MLPKLLEDVGEQRLGKPLSVFKKAVVQELQETAVNDLGCLQQKMGDFQEDAWRLQTLEKPHAYRLPKTKKMNLASLLSFKYYMYVSNPDPGLVGLLDHMATLFLVF